ncbi:hypothetical protein NN3_13490 [Nocardia neocaledoniensis NBRC 108232]|uniref:Uncharacterized protein n=1 Tax=Nocardia neocaledoniensis TaxID=236511 RepID=A0A317NS87_9NOCA|nr:hypothetical protein [Nocardia neocaledoniensis]PWV77955.1 hypothetical protein DFR69_103555 [Nocardia neocaledoniensis]GEM30342.1 hypothetical protein NN3_13490 [Nocardia neocaledoniensis NBRC 108232]
MRTKSLATETTLSTISPAEAEAKIAPVVALLEVPLLELRKSLGTNTSADPDADVVAALTSASTATSATEDPHRLGLYALESTETAAPATPALRRTATEVSAAADRGQRLSTLLGQAHSTQASAAAKVDAIIADFRAKAKAAAPAVNGNNLDAIVELAEEAITEAVGVVGTASTEMDGYTRNTRELTSDLDGTNGVTVPAGATEVAPGVYVLGTGGTSTDSWDSDSSTTTDPATAAQIALQEALIDGGVSLGTAAIDAGVTFGTHLIDKIAEVAMHGIDKGAELATTGIDTLAANVTGAESAQTSPATTTPSTPTTPSTSGGTSGGGLFAGLGNGDTTAKPEPSTGGGTTNNSTKPAPAAPSTQGPSTPAVEAPQQNSNPAPAPAAQQPPVQSGVIPPAARPQQDQETERPSAAPKHGQPGVVPATA